MTRPTSRPAWVNLAGSTALVVMIAAVGAAHAGQDQQRQGGMVQKGRDMQPPPVAAQAAGRPAGPVADISVSRSPEQTACEGGTAAACRTIESGLVTGGAWSFIDGGVMAMDDWESSMARQAASPSPGERMHSPRVVLTHRVLAACDSGDVSACRAFAASVRPATASERAETRTYTAGR